VVAIDREIGLFRRSQSGVRAIEMGAIRAEAWTVMLNSTASRAARPARAIAPLAYLVALLIALLAAAGPGAAPAVAQTAFACPTATITWTRGAGTDLWQTASNWDLNRVPTTTDHVCVPDLAGTAVVYNTLITTIASLTSDENLTISGGSLSLSGDLIGRKGLTITNGTFAVAGVESIVGGKLTLSGGTLRVTGQLAADGRVDWTAGIKDGAGTLLVRDGADVDDLTLSGTANKQLNAGTVVNEGHAVASGGSLFLNGGSHFENRSGATFDAAGDLDIGLSFSPLGVFANAGTFIKSAGAGTAASDVIIPFNNTGTVEVRAGTLRLANGGTHSGVFDVAAGTLLNFDGGTHDLTRANDAVRGAGVTRFRSGTIRLAQPLISGGPFELQGATFIVNAGPTEIGKLTWTSGTLTVGGTAAAPVQLAVTGPLDWTGGTKTGAGTLLVRDGPDAVDLTLSGTTANKSVNDGAVANEGRAVATGSALFLNGGAFREPLRRHLRRRWRPRHRAQLQPGRALHQRRHLRQVSRRRCRRFRRHHPVQQHRHGRGSSRYPAPRRRRDA
jgi:hypothetical protein